jgi:hypothetical protein
MANTVKVFDFKMRATGPVVIGAGYSGGPTQLSSECASDLEIDGQIQALKDDLDAVAIRMKKALRERGHLIPRSKNAPRS